MSRPRTRPDHQLPGDDAAPPARPGVTVFVQRPGESALRWHTGAAHLELAVPIGPDTTFNVGSVAKQITAHLLLLSARRGLLDLDRPVAAHLPRFALPDVTVADLVRHQGGVRDAESLLSLAGLRDLDHYTAEDLLELAFRQTRRCTAPGTFLYSNTGYLLLAAVLRTVHGTGLAELAERWVFAPLGMTASRFMADPCEVLPGAASSYAPTDDGWTRSQRPVTLPGPGSLWSSASDLARWLAYVEDNWPANQDLAFDTELAYHVSDHAPYRYGPGLYAEVRRTGDASVFHAGHEHGFSAAAHLSRTGLRMVCLSNNAAVAADHTAADVLTALGDGTRGRGDKADASVETIARVVSRRLSAASARPAAGRAENRSPTPVEVADRQTELGTYVCAEVPGTLRLTRAQDTLLLWRRGTCDRLLPVGPATYAGTGMRLVLPGPDGQPPDGGAGTSGTADTAPVGHFTLHLDRAPDLRYRRMSREREESR
ncbi:serine hydrolase domain-containing protein [Streptomyces chrestomyceticus]|uniref:serine hydrolase domain-containing protein n=1 Tax=Streptomyces chrestomyceticus TaxID=68185 RepID=UPI0037A50F9F